MKRSSLLRDLRKLERRLNEKQEEILRQLTEHLTYHIENEHKWGIVKLIRKHPGKAIAAAGILGKVLGQYIDLKQLVDLIQKIF